MNSLSSIRQYLHKYPELSGQEKQTAAKIHTYIKDLKNAELYSQIGGNGIVIKFEFGLSGPSVLIRGDMDALPIPEKSKKPYSSTNVGISHACGHDGHTTILIGLAHLLDQRKIEKGIVYLVFQPAEETGEGAKRMLEDDFFKDLNIDYALALHNIPGYKKNAIIVRDCAFTAAVTSMIVKLNGLETHAAEPELGVNPALALSKIINKINALQIKKKSTDYRIITPIHINMGKKAYGTSAGNAEFHLTIRSWSQENLNNLIDEILDILAKATKEFKIEISHSFLQCFQSNKNDSTICQHVRKAAKSLNLDVIEKETPFTWGEDFGLFTQQYKGAMFGLGAGEETPNLHNPAYDFPDDIIDTGVQMFYKIITQLINE